MIISAPLDKQKQEQKHEKETGQTEMRTKAADTKKITLVMVDEYDVDACGLIGFLFMMADHRDAGMVSEAMSKTK